MHLFVADRESSAQAEDFFFFFDFFLVTKTIAKDKRGNVKPLDLDKYFNRVDTTYPGVLCT